MPWRVRGRCVENSILVVLVWRLAEMQVSSVRCVIVKKKMCYQYNSQKYRAPEEFYGTEELAGYNIQQS